MTPRIITAASELEADQRYCTHCEKPLHRKVAWLELNNRAGTYHDDGSVPDGDSQGWFPFGMDCAKKLLAESCRGRT